MGSGSSFSGSARSDSTPACDTCGRHHRGECWGTRKITCFGCGELGHYKNECPHATGAGRLALSQVVGRGNTVDNTTGAGRGRGRGRGSNTGGGQNAITGARTQTQPNPRVFNMTRNEAPTASDVISESCHSMGMIVLAKHLVKGL
ncbi:uncharacterized protein [Euphorbia lathyris]|uniref:uncharacterized protein n=1 Tax=Euphorbia lathyris TaxID=212925 RepID=UPI003313F53D